MSKISLKHSGGNVVSLNSPTSAPTSADVAFKLPNADGTSGQALVTDASGNLSFAGTGKILQVVQAVKTDTFSSNSTSYADVTGMSAAITPSSSSNKVKVTVVLRCSMSQSDRWSSYILLRDSQILFDGTADNSRTQCSLWHINFEGTGNGNSLGDKNLTFLDSPSSTSALTYKLQVKVQSGATGYVNRSGNDANADYAPRTSSSITLEEVAG
tara:strand:+ start:708 stop:1346 length:639 start_codon:yes stop_codon:yes gene_type:complete